jgi:hypothetical protein
LKNKIIKKLLSIVFWGVIFAVVYRCPFKALTGIDCPACGVTRAFLCAIQGDFVTAFNYHPLFLLLGIEVLYYVLVYVFEIKKIRICNAAELTIMAITAVLMIIIWIFGGLK